MAKPRPCPVCSADGFTACITPGCKINHRTHQPFCTPALRALVRAAVDSAKQPSTSMQDVRLVRAVARWQRSKEKEARREK
jgi:hypothetical protein